MSSRVRIGIIVAVVGIVLIVLGGFAIFRLYQELATPQAEETAEPEAKINVVVTTRDLPLGALINEADISLLEVPVGATTRDVIGDITLAVGKITKVDLVQGEMVLQHNLATPTDVTHDIAYVLSENHVLMALPANDIMSKEAIIQRGDIVDVLVTYEQEITYIDDQGEEVTETRAITFDSMQGMEITAMVVDIIVQEDPEATEGDTNEIQAPRSQWVVTAYLVALDPQDALVLKHFKDAGAIFDFVIRAPTSTGEFFLTPVTAEYLKELYGLEILP